MPMEWLDKIFSQALDMGVKEIIPSTMGEPLIYRHFEHILTLCKKHQIKLNLTTNGTFPRKTVEEWANLIVPVTSDVKFSWNGATKETYEQVMKGIDFDLVSDNLKRFIAVRDTTYQATGHFCRVSLQLTFMETNMPELPAIVKLAAELGVDRVKGHHLWAHFQEIADQNYRRNKESIARWNTIVEETYLAKQLYLKADGSQVLLENIYPLAHEETSQEVPLSYECPFLNHELWVSPEGKVSPCCAPDELRQSLGNFGNIVNDSLSDVLNSEVYINLVTHYKENPLCQTCTMRKPK